MVNSVEIARFQVDVAPSRLWGAFLDSHNLLPRLIPDYVRKIEFITGHGEAGSTRLVTFGPAMNRLFDKVIERIESIDYEKRTVTILALQGVGMGSTYTYFKVTNSFQQGADESSSLITVLLDYEVAEGKEVDLVRLRQAHQMLTKVVEAYLIYNPLAYANSNLYISSFHGFPPHSDSGSESNLPFPNSGSDSTPASTRISSSKALHVALDSAACTEKYEKPNSDVSPKSLVAQSS